MRSRDIAAPAVVNAPSQSYEINLDAADEERRQPAVDPNRDLLLAKILDDADLSVPRLAAACGWIKAKVNRLLKDLAADRQPLVCKDRGRWVFTDAGRQALRDATPPQSYEQQEAVKPKRGRPKGSKNKPKFEDLIVRTAQ